MRTALVVGGIDYNCGSLYKTNLFNMLQAGAVTKADVDQAVKRVYKTMILLGMLDPMEGQPLVHLGPEVVDSSESRAVALRAAHESLVLLKNDGGLLPLSKGAKIAFIGPHANSTQSLLSNYHGDNRLVNTNSPYAAAVAQGLHVSLSEVRPPLTQRATYVNIRASKSATTRTVKTQGSQTCHALPARVMTPVESVRLSRLRQTARLLSCSLGWIRQARLRILIAPRSRYQTTRCYWRGCV